MAERRRRPTVVIAGLGDTGVLTAVNLPRTFEIVAVSTKTCLASGQELGARVTDPPRWKNDYLTAFERFKRLRDVRIVQGRVIRVDPTTRTLTIENADGGDRLQPFDVLVIATGISNGFWRDDQFADQAQVEAAIEQNRARLAEADTVAIVGGGPSGVSVAANLVMNNPKKSVHFFYSQALPLPGYHPDTRTAIAQKLQRLGVALHSEHRAALPPQERLRVIDTGRIEWTSGQPPFEASAIVWATGAVKPNSGFLPADMLDAEGFVQVDEFLRVRGQSAIFAIGDVAATDPHRSSARNWAAPLLARNIKARLEGRKGAMKPFTAPHFRWGSIVGLERDGLRIYQPTGRVNRISRWVVKSLLLPIVVKGMIYRGVRGLPR